MKTIPSLMLLLYAVMISTQAFAEARAPQLVLSAFVEALQKNDIEYLKKYVDLDNLKKQSRHGYTVESLKKLFAGVQVKEIKVSKPLYDKKAKIIRVSMNKPLSLDFELQHQNAVKGKGDFYRIIGIHP